MLRFAPSPTGDMHIQDLRIAILTYLVALQKNERFTIRIEDTNSSKNIEGKDTEIMQILEKFALIHNSVFHQSEHLHMHQTLAIKLLEEDKAFVCTCSEEEITHAKEEAKANNVPYRYSGICAHKDKTAHATLKTQGTPFVLRLKQPKETIVYNDILQGQLSFTPNDIDAFVILRADGTPSYDFACACADMLGDVSLIIREDQQMQRTVRQIHIQQQLGYDTSIDYAHLSLTFKENTPTTVKWLFEQGFVPDAIINYLLLLGSSNAPSEIFTLPEALSWYKIEEIQNENILFDIEKLKYINAQHLKNMDNVQLSSLFGFADSEVGKLIKLYLNEAPTIPTLALKIRPIFAPKDFECTYKKEMMLLQEIIAQAPMIKTYDTFENYLIEHSQLTTEELQTPLRLLLTGTNTGPKLEDIYPYIKSYLLEVAS